MALVRLPSLLLLLLLALVGRITAQAHSPEGGVPLSLIPRACADAAHAGFPFCDPSLPRAARVADLLARLSLPEKVLMLTARASPRGNVSALGLPEYNWGANCVHGVQSTCGTHCATSFPNPVNLGAAFDPALVRAMGRVIGWELRALWLEGARENYATGPHLGLDCWSPNINVNRDPRWGRNMETPSEDPLAAARYAVAYTRGLQEGRNGSSPYLQAVVTLKHWAAYSLEHYGGVDRMQFDAKVSPYDFADTYLPAFRAAVEPPARARGVMCSYNRVNGVPMCANAQLNAKLLRDTLGFDGYITSDSGAIEGIYAAAHYTKTLCEAGALAIRAGTDVNSGSVYTRCLEALVREGKLDEQRDIDPAMRRTLELRFDLGLFDPIENQPYWHVPPSEVNTPEARALSLNATRKSLVLLQNDGQALPLAKKGLKKIAVLGPHAQARGGMMGNYYGQICHGDYLELGCVQTPVDAITEALQGTATTVQYERGCGINDTSTDGFDVALAAAESSDAVVLFLGIDTSIEREAGDRDNIDLPATQLELLRQVRRATSASKTPVVVVLFNGGVIGCEELVRHADAVLEAFYPGFFGARAIAEVLFGDVNPSGKLPVTMYRSDYIHAVDMKSMDMTKFPGRSYRYYKHVPVFPFGHGLSYTTFTLRNAEPGATATGVVVTRAVGATLSVELANTGTRAGEEVVFAFFRALQTNVTGPATLLNEQLFDYTRVALAPGASRALTFAITPETLALHDERGDLVSFPGFYEVVVTNGVHERVTYAVHVVGEARVVRPFLSRASTFAGDADLQNPAVAMAAAAPFAKDAALESAAE